jgi:hypothetical protein
VSLYNYMKSPQLDETFSSWAFRNYLNSRASAKSGHFVPDTIVDQFLPHGTDCDYGLTRNQQVHVAEMLAIPLNNIIFICRKPKHKIISEINRRRYYCACCINQDIAEGRLPSWRRKWDMFYYFICEIHRVRLTYLFFDFNSSANKAWAAFLQECEISSTHLPLTSRARQITRLHSTEEQYSLGWSYLWHQGERAQMFCSLLHREKHYWPFGVFKGIETYKVKHFAESIVSLLLRSHLKQSERHCYVSRLLRDPICYQPGFNYQVSEACRVRESSRVADIRMRLLAVLMFHILIGCYADKQLTWFAIAFECAGMRLDLNPSAIKEELLSSNGSSYNSWLETELWLWHPKIRNYWASL